VLSAMCKTPRPHPYNRRRWKLARRRQLFEDPLCNECGMMATDVDHIVPINQGGDTWASSNLQSLCHACHSAKSAREMAT
jgi:5-methylcytosine-specific restriction protein A